MERKYELIEESCITLLDGHELYRIKALKNFDNVKKGDIGGYIEKEDNLSHEDNCWIYDNAMVYNDAEVYNNAKIFGDAKVFGDAMVFDNARVSGNARVYGMGKVSGHAVIYNDAEVYDFAKVSGDAEVFDRARIYDLARVYNHTKIYDNARVYGYAEISDDACISNDANISSNDDYITIKGLGSYNRDTTFFKCSNDTIKVNCGCFNGTLDEFVNKVNITHKDDDKYRKEYLSIVETIKIHFYRNYRPHYEETFDRVGRYLWAAMMVFAGYMIGFLLR